MLDIFRIIALAALTMTLSCSGRRSETVTDNSNAVSVEINDVPMAVLDASKYIDSVRYIKLDDTPEMPIMAISEVFITDSLLIVSEYRQKMVVFYDLNGKYLRRISKRGRGPGEYVTIGNVMVDTMRNNIIVYDNEVRRLLFYDFNGMFLRSIDDFSEKAVIRDMINLPDGGYLCYRPDRLTPDYPGGLWYVDENGKPGEYYYRLDKVFPSHLTQYPYSLYNISKKGIGFAEAVFSDIYHYDSDGLHKSVSYRLPGKSIYDAKGLSSSSAETGSMVMNTESDKFIITEFITGDMQYGMVVFSKENNNYETGIGLVGFEGTSAVRNNIPGVRSSIIGPELLLGYTRNEQISNNIRSLVNDLTREASEEEILKLNPVIQLLYLKN